MNQVNLIGRLTREPDIRYSAGNGENLCIAAFTLAVDRAGRKNNEQSADFITCKAFGKTAEVFEKYVHQGDKIGASGRIQTGSYTNKDGQRVYTTDVIVERIDFCGNSQRNNGGYQQQNSSDFVAIPDDSLENVPFN